MIAVYSPLKLVGGAGDNVTEDAGCQVRDILLIPFKVLKCSMCQLSCNFCTRLSQMPERVIFITWSHVWLSIVMKMRSHGKWTVVT